MIDREYLRILRVINKNTLKNVNKNDVSVKERLATVVSVQTGTITVTFENETLQVPGIVLPSGITVSPTDTVLLSNSSNTAQSSGWRVTRVY